MKLGWCDVCLRVTDVRRTRAFYERLGFKRVEGQDEEGWAVVVSGETRLGLYEPAHVGDHPVTLNFRGQNIAEAAAAVKQLGLEIEDESKIGAGPSGSFLVRDPDGVGLFFDTAPGEIKKS